MTATVETETTQTLPELSAQDFTAFYSELYKDPSRVPHAWQMALFEQARAGRWPDAVTAPTGAGKSILPIVHVFLCALDHRQRARMCFVTPRRIITDQIHDEAIRLLSRLNDPDAELSPVLAAVRTRLLARQPELIGGGHVGCDAVCMISVRGGRSSAPDRRWADTPTACTLLTMTVNMAMSRLLFGGYQASAKNRSVEAGLLAHDTVMVFDEAHLVRQSASVARDVAAAVTGRESGVIGLHVIEVTATPTPDMRALPKVLSIDQHPVPADSALGRIMAAAKPFTVVHRKAKSAAEADLGKYTETATAAKTVKSNTSAKASKPADDVHEDLIALALHREVGRGSASTRPGPIGVVCNTVAQAIAVCTAIRLSGVSAVCLTGRMRPHDRQQLLDEYPGVLTADGNPDVDVVVATQTIEVGVDCDFAAMVTQMCPGDALVQRVGRVNRRGVYPRSPVVIVDQEKVDGPYRESDIRAAREWLTGLDGDLSLDTLRPEKVPHRSGSRPVIEHLGPGTASKWFRTSGTDMPAVDERALWIADDLDNGPGEVSLVLRRIPSSGPLTADPEQRHELLKALRPDAVEKWKSRSVVIGDLLRTLTYGSHDRKSAGHSAKARKGEPYIRTVDGIAAITLIDNHGFMRDYLPAEADPPAGSTVVVWCAPVHRDGADICGVPMLAAGVPSYKGTEIAGPVPVEELNDGRFQPAGEHPYVLLGDGVPDVTDDDVQAAQSCHWNFHADAATWFAAKRAACCPDGPRFYVKLGHGDDDENGKPAWAVITRWHETSTQSRENVLLRHHRADVAEAAVAMARSARLPQRLVEALWQAGLYHDDGKADSRFQRWMRGRADLDGGAALAKSGEGAVAGTVRNRPLYGKPRGWRHEQLSAAIAYSALEDHPDRDLVTLLAGFSHGHGRMGFPHGFATLTGDEHPGLVDIFSDGTWEDTVIAAGDSLGPWTLSYLDALLRAADHQVSAQGH